MQTTRFFLLPKQRTITKVLVANRGEIACRVFKTARKLGLRTVALYCDAEPSAKHIEHADEAYCVGSPPASTSYLNVNKILSIALKSGADAIHPGYGFLSENAAFSELVESAGIAWIGPPSEAIRVMGSKSESKLCMEAAGVPVVPGYHGKDQSDETLMEQAGDIGFPLLIKAVSGGGGKGMKIVHSQEDLLPMIQSARREALNFFKDEELLLEKYIEFPRHIECQVFCDQHGGGVFFFERDCSVQRRYQKVLEEAPVLSNDVRSRLGEIALTAARTVHYVGAGTVEFILDTVTDEFFFMEMNTRLQVEHPVTEEVSRIRGKPTDLVQLQLQVAEGKPLGFMQDDLSLDGHCIEARVFAESPAEGFLPASGRLELVREPKTGPRGGGVHVRVDSGFRSGDDVLIHYDPMIAKLIVWGPTRQVALAGLREALDEFIILGIKTNITFLKACCDHDKFKRGGVSTKFITEHPELLKPVTINSVSIALAAISHLLRLRNNVQGLSGIDSSSLSTQQRINFLPEAGDTEVSVKLTPEAKIPSQSAWLCEVTHGMGVPPVVLQVELCHKSESSSQPDRFVDAAWIDGSQKVQFTVHHGTRSIIVETSNETVTFYLPSVPLDFGDISSSSKGTGNLVHSPMPGKVTKLLVNDGDTVTCEQAILVLEAMKMEHIVHATNNGVVRMKVTPGSMVSGDQILAKIEVSENAEDQETTSAE